MRPRDGLRMRRNRALAHTVLPVMLHSVQAALPVLGPDWMDPNYLLAQYGTALIWDTTGRALRERRSLRKIANEELEAIARDLAAQDASTAHRAVRALVAVPGQAVPLPQRHLPLPSHHSPGLQQPFCPPAQQEPDWQ